MKNALLVLTVLLSGAAEAAVPPHGVPLHVRRGFYTETDIGAFFTLGGNDLYSNPQSYLQLGLGERFYLTPKVLAGQTLLDPAPVGDVTQGFNLGAGVGLEYATSMDHFSVGMDVVARYVFRANIPAFSVFPRVKYTF